MLECEVAGIEAYVPQTQTSGNQAKGLFGKRDFIYRSDKDEYECPAGETNLPVHQRRQRQDDPSLLEFSRKRSANSSTVPALRG